MIAPEQHRARRSAPAETVPFTVVEELTLGRVTAWPAQRAHELLAAPDWRERLAAMLRDDVVFRTAILIASAGLRPVVERVLRGEPLDERAAARLLAYAVRMATRTTPFGIFASVGAVAFGSREACVDDVHARVAHANVDHEWLVGAVDALAERTLADGEDLVVVTATALRREGPRFALLDERKVFATAEGTQYRSVTIAATPPVSRALELARDGCSVDALARALADAFAVGADRARSLLRKLVDARFLVPAAHPAPLDDAAGRLAAFARTQPSLTPLVAALHGASGAHPGIPDLAALDATVERLKASGPADVVQPVFYDFTHAPLALPENVREDVVRLADVLVRCGTREHLDAFRKRFYERYESGERLVPLLELLGPHGIGIPLTTEFDRAVPPDAPNPARRFRLAALVGAALAGGAREIALSDEDWRAIRPDRPAVPPPSLEVGFCVLAPSFEAVSAGEYRIVSSPMTASYGAGKTTGRFAKYQPGAFAERLRQVVAAEAPAGAITAEPVFVPERARSGNVIAHPVVAEATIPINVHGGGGDVVALDDLLVGIADDRVTLWSRARRKCVHVVWPHAFNALLAPPLARFFAFVARDGGRVPVPFDVGELGALPFVPRIRLGRVVLRRATWTFSVAELHERGLAALARERGIPAYALFGDGDNVLAIDTRGDAGAALLRDQTRARKPDDVVGLAEAFVDDDDLWLRDARGARYAGEFIASLRSVADPPADKTKAAVREAIFVDETARTRTPGSEWCYLALYANDREFRSEIAPRLLQFGEQATEDGLAAGWFYVLYADPDQHVRLRLRSGGDDAALRERAIAFAEELVHGGVVTRYRLATYERELERYGGADGMVLCERLFHHDSARALRGPSVDVLAGSERLEALALPLLRAFDALTTPDERERWIDTRRPQAHAASRDESGVLRLLAAAPPAPDDDHAAVARALAACCGGVAPYLDVVDSVLHMHLNRRGVARDEELALRRLLWKALFARRSRRAR
ncbi:MAG TPA: lantibiotic dehydratase [Candidatus Elarobacter sp.]|nr:lantibiotic dehydratase [Candidatus Elarobacter sp.]